MKVAVFSTKPYVVEFLEVANAGRHELLFHEARLGPTTAVLADGCDAVCAFVNDVIDASVVDALSDQGVRLIAMRCSGYNNVDLHAADRRGVMVANVPAYSPHAVAQHTLALLLALNRKVHRAWSRVREGNYALDGLMGYDLQGRTAGIVGTGAIGTVTAQTFGCLGMEVLGTDPFPNPALEGRVEYVALDELLERSSVVTLHCPLTPETEHVIDAAALARMEPNATLLNTSRGALIDTTAVIDSLKSGHLGGLGIDVYEEEAQLFFEDRSEEILMDDTFARLLTFPNVIVTAHQGFFTTDAMTTIAEVTLNNVSAVEEGTEPPGRVAPKSTA